MANLRQQNFDFYAEIIELEKFIELEKTTYTSAWSSKRCADLQRLANHELPLWKYKETYK